MSEEIADKPVRKRRRWLRVLLGLLLILVLGALLIVMSIWTATGKPPNEERRLQFAESRQFKDGAFFNRLAMTRPDRGNLLKKWFFDRNELTEPSEPIPLVTRTEADFSTPSSELRITWMGHSTMLIEVDGKRIVTDPVWGNNASPGRLFGVGRFHAPPIPLEDLPTPDVVLISHDHYDHLNEVSIRFLADRVPVFLAPLGVGSHLEYWGVPAEKIIELDWWESHSLDSIELVAVPSRHFSGRLFAQNETLWTSWVIKADSTSTFFSGDTGFHDDFAEIAERYGPFDVTMMEVGAYFSAWPDSHLGPEQALEAHRILGGKVMMPIHWGTFNLAFHGWTEPAERLLAAIEKSRDTVAIPRPGEFVYPSRPDAPVRWWPDQAWETEKQAPIQATGISR